MKRFERKSQVKNLLKKYGHIWVCGYILLYLPYFFWLESVITDNYKIMHVALDDMIPFSEYFIIPYIIWFFYVSGAVLYFFFTDKKGYYQLTAFLFTGMTIFLIICTVFPNELNLRPHTFANDTVFTRLVQQLYSTDTPTNVLPSIHVYNSLGAAIAIGHSQALKKHRGIQFVSYGLAGLIILSTMFLKQHSVTDVIAAVALTFMIYPLIYVTQTKRAPKLSQQPI